MSEQQQKTVVGYRMTLPEVGQGRWLFLGTTPDEVAEAIKNQIDELEGMSADEIDTMQIEAREYTQDEIDNMPEFLGW